jgi:archaemetzincin
MFSLLHCTLYECNMCGSNHREEADRRPIALCPECLAKVCWATRADPVERFAKLAAFCHEHGLKPEQEFYERSLRALDGEPSSVQKR